MIQATHQNITLTVNLSDYIMTPKKAGEGTSMSLSETRQCLLKTTSYVSYDQCLTESSFVINERLGREHMSHRKYEHVLYLTIH